jgi:uncharacterized protein YjiS (DUF1127 family)
MMTQPIQKFKNLSSETTPAGGNAYADTVGGKVALWMGTKFKHLVETVRADFRLRAAEAQLYRMSDRELADFGLARIDIPFAVRRTAMNETVEGETPRIAGGAGAIQAANQNLRRAA